MEMAIPESVIVMAKRFIHVRCCPSITHAAKAAAAGESVISNCP